MGMLPFEPETIESLRDRLEAAFIGVFDGPKLDIEGGVFPFDSRDHIFDFEDGHRLCISVDIIDPRVGPVLHISGGFYGPQFSLTKSAHIAKAEEHIYDLFQPDLVALRWVGFSPCGVAHWLSMKPFSELRKRTKEDLPPPSETPP